MTRCLEGKHGGAIVHQQLSVKIDESRFVVAKFINTKIDKAAFQGFNRGDDGIGSVVTIDLIVPVQDFITEDGIIS